jgi:MFS family permease
VHTGFSWSPHSLKVCWEVRQHSSVLVPVLPLIPTIGLNASSANIHAYIADCSDPASRSRVFSVYLGLVYIGMAVGPAFGGLLIRQSGDLLTVFYFAFAIHLSFACMVWFAIPESLAPTQLFRAKVAHSENKARTGSGVLAHLASFFAPLSLFMPVTVATGDNPLKRRRDWNLTLLAAAHGFVMMLMVRASLKGVAAGVAY